MTPTTSAPSRSRRSSPASPTPAARTPSTRTRTPSPTIPDLPTEKNPAVDDVATPDEMQQTEDTSTQATRDEDGADGAARRSPRHERARRPATPGRTSRRPTSRLHPEPAGPDRAAGGMGVSSERVGPTGPGQDSTDGLRDTTPVERPDDAEVAPGRAAGRPRAEPRRPPAQGGLLLEGPALGAERGSRRRGGADPAHRGGRSTAAILRAVQQGRSKTWP